MRSVTRNVFRQQCLFISIVTILYPQSNTALNMNSCGLGINCDVRQFSIRTRYDFSLSHNRNLA